ncbi:urease accessory protein UreF [uncultured Phenylobacterium sp.]|uniref:urease accessory protein UreF n=1 Tax=uncultured Phenylobacterium sp. TaxID=349273 RepID=UPI0025DB09CB|nr:urease accessory UreF family protein [uncultured Phenylobacterium sp.]
MDTDPGPAALPALLFAWFSPAFPTGGFAWSHGLEAAAAHPAADEAWLGAWLEDVLMRGGGWSDAVLMNLAWNAGQTRDVGAWRDVGVLAMALCSSRERRAETLGQGDAFVAAVREGWPALAPPGLEATPYPVTAGWSTAALGAPATDAIAAYLTGFAANLIAAGVRLSLCGQAGAVRILARIAPRIANLAARAATASEDDLGGCAIAADIAAMRHETLDGRLFLS